MPSGYATKLEQGRTQRASVPIDCSEPVPPTQDKFDAGGCGCRTTSSTSSTGGVGVLAALGALAMAAARRRRRATGRDGGRDGADSRES